MLKITTVLLSALMLTNAWAIVLPKPQVDRGMLPAVLPSGHQDQDSYQDIMRQRQLVHNYQQQVHRDIRKLTQAQVNLLLLQQQTNVADSGLSWQPATAATINQAVAFHKKNQAELKICQAGYDNNIYPGVVTPKGCLITYGGKAYTKQKFRVLLDQKQGSFQWVAPKKVIAEQKVPGHYSYHYSPTLRPLVLPRQRHMNPEHNEHQQQAAKTTVQPILGGYENEHYVYICRTNLADGMHIGKVVGNSCLVAVKGREASLPDYKVLTTGKKIKTHADNDQLAIQRLEGHLGVGPVIINPKAKQTTTS